MSQKKRKPSLVLKSMASALLGFLVIISFTTASAGSAVSQADADVLNVEVSQSAPGVWRFDVTVTHPDTGWEDYVDGWDVVLPNEEVVKPNAAEQFTRTLWHPHVGQASFTRSQSGVLIPADVSQVIVRAHDKIHGFGGKELTVLLSK